MGDSVEIKYLIEWCSRKDLAGDICDYCGERIDEFPCAVLLDPTESNPHALCQSCRMKSNIHPGDNEYFETLAYQAKMDPPMPGKNFGGRRKTS